MDSFKTRRLRIMDPGLINYTGEFGLVEFKDGVSVAKVGWREANMLAAIVHVEDADDEGFQLGSAADLTRHRDRPADAPEVTAAAHTGEVNGQQRMVGECFNRAELEDIADKKGLAGVRDIARAWKRTGRSIQECIDNILEAQNTDVTKTKDVTPGA